MCIAGAMAQNNEPRPKPATAIRNGVRTPARSFQAPAPDKPAHSAREKVEGTQAEHWGPAHAPAVLPGAHDGQADDLGQDEGGGYPGVELWLTEVTQPSRHGGVDDVS